MRLEPEQYNVVLNPDTQQAEETTVLLRLEQGAVEFEDRDQCGISPAGVRAFLSGREINVWKGVRPLRMVRKV